MTLIRFRDDAAHEEPAGTLDDFLGQTNATAVRLEAGEDARALLPHLNRLALIEIAFPTFRDGRGYSAARILREAGYAGELRAQGEILLDQVVQYRRCGFDALASERELDPAAVETALSRFPQVYQPAADARAPVWRLRHG
ncbi:DUF934 domain-containing protein [uncultured Sphingomonas sp.]|uniref:DUF934 domain-containing protein n=1 Tax=uncultured Sphingomonas sp. TaxID=158754 RepID=UPI0025FE65B5|nr:DUF934 domain-containing protein [uncultured Sphingomonas sp.]